MNNISVFFIWVCFGVLSKIAIDKFNESRQEKKLDKITKDILNNPLLKEKDKKKAQLDLYSQKIKNVSNKKWF